MHWTAIAAGSLLLAGAVPAAAELPVPPAASAAQNATSFLFTAGASDAFEIVTAQMALKHAASPAVRSFAAMLINDHSNSTNAALATAKGAGVMAPPPELSPMQKDMVGQLIAAPPASFDRTYLSQQVPAHQQALALMQRYAAGGDVPALRNAASATVPMVQAHLAQAQRLLASAR